MRSGHNLMWADWLTACSLIAIQDGSCLRELLQKSSGDVFSSAPWNVPRVSEDRKGQRCFLDSFRICEKWCCCVFLLSLKKTSSRNPLPAVYLSLGYQVCRIGENQSIESKFNKSHKYLEGWHTETLNWIKEERSRNQTVSWETSLISEYQCSFVCNYLSF